MDSDEVVEVIADDGFFRSSTVHEVNRGECVVLLAVLKVIVARLADCTDDGVALAEVVLFDLSERDINVSGTGEVAGGANERIVIENVQDPGDGDENVIIADTIEIIVATTSALAVTLAATAVVRRSVIGFGRVGVL
jgi:hypothetical protein